MFKKMLTLIFFIYTKDINSIIKPFKNVDLIKKLQFFHPDTTPSNLFGPDIDSYLAKHSKYCKNYMFIAKQTTWGDNLYFIFSKNSDVVQFVISVQDYAATKISWYYIKTQEIMMTDEDEPILDNNITLPSPASL